MNDYQDAFISYGRADSKAFAIRLHDRLTQHDLHVWLDQHDIPWGVDFKKEIEEGIARAHHFIFIIAPHSVHSEYCWHEIECALKYNKRIIPVLHIPCDEKQIHPYIRKLNWIDCQQEDQVETALDGLVTLLSTHQDYVEQHTLLLAKALEWERNHKQVQYLLTGEDRDQAEAWLRQKFETGQPPCEPANLHCEFICESIKNANNLMTQVFLAHAEQDKAVTEKIRQTLMRQGITVWTHRTDIRTGTDFQTEIDCGIEATDNVIYLISPNSLQSTYCQQELNHAIAYNKRIISLLIEPTDLEEIPSHLRNLQFINFTKHEDEENYRDRTDELLNILYEEASYYEMHKLLLVKALKWQEQNYNSSILLRGYNLEQFAAWLRVAKQRDKHPPLPLQEEFIAESQQQLSGSTLEVFISYSRADSDFARKLNDALQTQGKTTWFDQESIASGADFHQEIYRGIENSDNFLFIISPRSVASSYCGSEVEYARKLNKRIITVLHQRVEHVHPSLANIQWIDFKNHNGDFYVNFSELIRALEIDREHVHSHTQWLQRALQWEKASGDVDLLLRGTEFATAASWLAIAEQRKQQPPATALQKEFIRASREAIDAEKRREKRRIWMLRSMLGLVSTALMISVGMGAYAMKQKTRSEMLLDGQIKALGQESLSLIESDRGFDALLKAIKAGQLLSLSQQNVNAGTQAEVIAALQESLYSVRERSRLEGHTKAVHSVGISPDHQMLATTSADGTAKLWSRDGRLLQTLTHADEVWGVSFSPDSQLLATWSRDKTIQLWNHNGQLLHTLHHNDEVWSVSFSPDGQRLASRSRDKTIKLWNRSGTLLETLKFNHEIWGLQFSSDGQKLLSVDQSGTIQLWKADGENLQKGTTIRHSGTLAAVFSPDSETIVTRNQDHTIQLWNLNGKKLTTLKQDNEVRTFNFSPDGQLIAVGLRSGAVKLWDLKGKLLQTLQHTDRIMSVHFSPDGKTLLTTSIDRTTKLWNLKGEELYSLKHDDEVRDAIFIPETSMIATLSGKTTLKLWDLSNRYFKVLGGHTGRVGRILFSPDRQTMITTSWDSTARLWNREGQIKTTLKGHTASIREASFSPDGKTVATTSDDRTLRLWNLEGKEILRLQHHNQARNLSFSADGQVLAVNTLDQNGSSNVQLWRINGQGRINGQAKPIQLLPAQWTPQFIPDQPILVTVSYKSAYLWTPDGKLLQVLNGHQDILRNVSFSPDRQLIATASDDKTAKIWTLDGKNILTLHQDGVVRDVRFSPDGQTIATASEDNTAKIWNRKGELLHTLEGHKEIVFEVRFSPDGQTIATASNDKTVKLWNREGKLLQTLRHSQEILKLNFSPDGQQLAVATAQDSGTLWQLGSLHPDQHVYFDHLMQQACDWVGNYLKNKPETDGDRRLCNES